MSGADALDLTAARTAIAAADSAEALDDVARALVGKRSAAATVKESIKTLPADERPVVGRAVSEFTKAVQASIEDRRRELARAEAGRSGPSVDLTLGGHGRRRGHLHLITQTQRELEDVFIDLGYQVAEGPEVEDDWHNFEALNFPPDHPARAMQDTFYVQLGEPEQVVLRTHTSPVQIRVMETQPPPIFAVTPGRVYRNEAPSPRNSSVFHQIEGLAVDRGITFGDLSGTMAAFTTAYFGEGVQSRLLPSFFPFTEPSAEYAVSCPFCDGAGCRVCSHTSWIELGGCGMVDPNVFRAVGIDPEEYSGFAFGFGIERMAMIKYGVQPIKTFYDSDVRFLEQY
ncbi:MAG TPA: phenylalanine--tRNA ligase subunit alpha [Acidimicrobiia bacterium]|nr:phenylalanine--tRNA ligase subunit alpha [Acidimicrobiia bacterium]